MIKLEYFLYEEMCSSVRSMILESVNQAIRTGKFQDEWIFNRYILKIFYNEKKVFVYDDISPEEDPLIMQLEDFVKVIEDYKSV